MKFISFTFLFTLMSSMAFAEISSDWLDDDILFDDEEVELIQSVPQDELDEPATEEQIDQNLDNQSEDEGNTVEESPAEQDSQIEEPEQVQESSSQITTNEQAQSTSNTVPPSNEKTTKLDNVVITGDVDNTTMTEETQKLFSMPGAAGDPLKALEALPGITSEFSFVGAPSVRGSAPEDNSYLVDNLPVANLYHLLGYSIFSDNVVQNFDIQTGAFPAKYAGGTGAAIYVDLRQPKNEPFSWTLDLGMFHSGFFLESKINDNQSVYFGARKSTISYFAPIIMPLLEAEPEPEPDEDLPPAPTVNQFPNSDDVYFKYHNKINDQHQLSLMIIGAQDYFGIEFPEDSEIEEQEPALIGALAVNSKQSTTGLNWRYEIDSTSNLNTSLGHLFFNSEFIIGDGLFNNLDVNSLIAKTNYQNNSINNHSLSFGAEIQSDNAVYTSRLLNNPCSRLDPGCSFSAGVIIETGDDITINYLDGYAQDEWFINDNITWVNGFHVSYDDYIGDAILQPRSKFEFNWYDEWIFNAAFGIHHQFPEITNLLPEFGNPDLKNITAQHYVLGVEKNTYSGLKIKTDTYYKKLNNLVLATNDERLYSNQANGDAYGFELLIEQEKIGSLSGFVALSLSKSTRTNEITDETALFELDKPFVFDWVMEYEPNERWKIGSKWNLKSGSLYTPIIGSQPFENFPDAFEPIYAEVNSERLPMTHQLDLRIEYKKKKPNREITYYVDILNVYNFKTVQGYSYNADYSESEEETGGTPLLPLFGMKMTF